jgi:hypothetical protein
MSGWRSRGKSDRLLEPIAARWAAPAQLFVRHTAQITGADMIFPYLLIIITLLSGTFFMFGSIPGFLQWVSLIFGIVAILSRTLAWLTGAAQHGLSVLKGYGSKAVRMNLIMEFSIWVLAFLNLFFFFAQ